MSHMINVQPAPGLLRQFAQWAVEQHPKIRTSGPAEFAVPADLFAVAPEEVLIGALVDGHRYVSPDEDAAEGRPAPGAPELLGVATPAGLTPAVGDPEGDAAAMVAATSPAAVEAAMTAALVAANAASGNLPEPDQDSGPEQEAPEGVFPCPQCEREFTTDRGRDAHRRQVHRED